MKMYAVVLGTVLAAALAAGCAEAPTDRVNAARAKVDGVAAEGMTYAPTALQAAQDTVKQLDAEVQAQAGTWAVRRSYDRTLELAAAAEAAADNVRQAVDAEKARLAAETATLTRQAQRELADARAAVKRLPRARRAAFAADLNAASSAISAIDEVADGDVRAAHRQAEAATQATSHLESIVGGAGR